MSVCSVDVFLLTGSAKSTQGRNDISPDNPDDMVRQDGSLTGDITRKIIIWAG